MKNLITYASQINWSKALLISITAILVLGTFTALWKNPFFIRMSPITIFDFLILGIESLLLGLYLSLKKKSFAIKSATTGSVLGFLGFACPVCNKILLLLFGSTLLLSYFEPIRYYVGFLGTVVIAFALYKKLII